MSPAATPFELMRTRQQAALELSQARQYIEPWRIPPPEARYFDAIGTISLPAQGSTATVIQVNYEEGFAAVLKEIAFVPALDNAWISGDGQITWSITQNAPDSGANLLTALTLPFYAGRTEQLGSLAIPWPLPAYGHRFGEYDTLQLKVTNVSTNTGLVTGVLRGYFYPLPR